MYWVRPLLALVVSFLYVASIYCYQPNTLKGRHRDENVVIKHRLKRVSIACFVATVLVLVVLVHLGTYSGYAAVFRALQLKYNGQALANCILSMSVLYCGPLINQVKQATLADNLRDCLCLQGFRDYIFAPLTEEYIYRALVLTILEPQGDHKFLIIFTPLLFGIAHLHHGYELYHVQKRGMFETFVIITVQFIYTTLFGILENYVFFKYSNLITCVMVHSLCNFMGFPDFNVEGSTPYKLVYYSLMIIGAYLFFKLL
ncbi:uncharacterized protein PRCAT00004606001 [Priceomyces carsonii]|uniref:uncharacterized protein n=1 Tax=Priceomyces carsonii TaxID=28549 RepID=UPI002ED987AC|nr:unnamed protein product [Priceomyces carsonii]